MSKDNKDENVKLIESIRATEEFLFVVEKSSELIRSLILGGFDINKFHFYNYETRLRHYAESFYLDCKKYFYIDSDKILNGLVEFNAEIMKDLMVDSFVVDGIEYKDDGEFDCDIDVYQIYQFKHKEFLKKKYGSEEPAYLTLKDNKLLINYFQDRAIIEEFRKLAAKNKSSLKRKEEFILRLQNVVKLHEDLLVEVINIENQVSMEIKLWRELILENSRELLYDLTGENLPHCSVQVRTLILKSFIEAVGINSKSEVNQQKFIAGVLATTQKTVHAVFNKFKIPNMGLKKDGEFDKQIEEAKNICEYLINEEENPERVRIINNMIDKISDTVPRK